MAKVYSPSAKTRKKLCKSSLVLGIVGVSFAPIMPAVSYACSVPGLVIALNKRRKQYNAIPGITLNIVALSLALINSLIGVVMVIKLFLNQRKQDME